MEINNESIAPFDDFAKSLKQPEQEPELKLEPVSVNLDEIKEQVKDGVGLKCPYCSWTTHANAKNKPRGLKMHISKCSSNPKNKDLEEKPKKKEFKINIEKKEKEREVEIEDVSDNEEEKREKLISDLDILKIKFPTIKYTWNYTQSSSIHHLERQRANFLRILNDEAGTQAMFKLLVVGSKGIEKLANLTNVIDIDGYAQDVNDNHEEIYPILKNLIDTGVLSVSHLSPELRLGIILGSLALTRMDKNRNKDKSFLKETGLDSDAS